MPDLPQRKIGLVSCSGEELPEGTITRLATLQVLENLKPAETVTICLPLFLAGGEGDRNFAKFYPTIAIDGCEKRCAFYGTAKYSNAPAASIVITEIIRKHKLEKPEGLHRLNDAGKQAVDIAVNMIAAQVNIILEKSWNRTKGKFDQCCQSVQPSKTTTATCSCSSGIPVQQLSVNGKEISFSGLPLIFESFRENKKNPSEDTLDEIMGIVKIYNQVKSTDEKAVRAAIQTAYEKYYSETDK